MLARNHRNIEPSRKLLTDIGHKAQAMRNYGTLSQYTLSKLPVGYEILGKSELLQPRNNPSRKDFCYQLGFILERLVFMDFKNRHYEKCVKLDGRIIKSQALQPARLARRAHRL